MDFDCGRPKNGGHVFQGWRVPGVFTSRLGKTKFLELGFWSKLIVVHQNALSQRLPMAAVGFLHEKIEGAWGSQFGCRAQERILWILFVHPSDKNQEPTSHLQKPTPQYD